MAKSYLAALRSLISYCRAARDGGYTPSDFPLARLSQPRLDQLLRTRAGVEDIYPLAPMQAHMLRHALASAEPGLYIVHQIIPLRGLNLDTAAFERAWRTIVARHAVMRSAFAWGDPARPLQVVFERADVYLEQHDWRAFPPARQERLLDDYAHERRQRGFDLARAPHVRLALFRLAEDDYQFFWMFSYMLQDGWSFPLVLKDFFTCYMAYAQGQEPALERAGQYRDHIAWLQRQDLSEAELFWRAALRGFTAPTPLVERAGKGQAGQGEGYTQQHIVFSLAATTALRSLARQHQLTMNTLIQGAWALLLSCYTGEEDIVFGSVSSGRPVDLPGAEYIVGSFNNLLPMRARAAPDMELLPWLADFQGRQVELRQYEHSPPIEVKRWSEIADDRPLFESYLVFENYPVDTSVVEGTLRWNIRSVEGITQTEHPLRIQVWPTPLVVINICYYRRHFDSGQIAAMLGDFEMLLGRMLANPRRRLGDVLRGVAAQQRL
jgi:hypothetical protein